MKNWKTWLGIVVILLVVFTIVTIVYYAEATTETITYYPDGKIKAVNRLDNNGRLHGTQTTYHQNGVIESIIERRHGVWIWYKTYNEQGLIVDQEGG